MLTMCTLLEWSENGDILAIVQANSASLVLWEPKKIQQHQLVDLPCKDISFIKWSKSPHSLLLAIGTNRGQVYIYDHHTGTKTQVAGKHKRRILCGDWNFEDKFAFGSEDRQITICLPSGRTFDQVKIKASPQSVTFGGKTEDKDAILSVNMGGKTILLYDLNERENALELAFQARYGNIVSYQWFGNGYIIAGFSSGYVVIISTHLNEIGQEQYCAKFHEHSLREIVYNEANGTVATCGDNCIKVVRMSDWKEIAVEYLDSEPTAPSTGSTASGNTGSPPTSSSMLADLSGPSSGSMQAPSLTFEDLQWTPDGRILSVSSHNGCLHNFMILSSALRPSLFDLDSPIAAVLKPIAPWTMLFTMGFMVIAVLFVLSVQFQVSCMDVVRAMTGFVEGL
ncbi:WD repeat-containing protein 19 [Phytophthora citrophthora]|uniref:WD repeat-containing protein 19 n=1 Tax=Phytophthora citrophthora TaxID=4793 RepID=A0AAD9GZ48_9STRA|nr:WD repeat-containing protein 19 [Phytophthora citrophthora]